MPFLSIAPTRGTDCPPITPLNSVGVAPKSASNPCCATGIVHWPTRLRSEARSSYIDGPPGVLGQSGLGVPVVKYMVPAAASRASELHTPPPVQPLGTRLNVFCSAPVTRSSLRT